MHIQASRAVLGATLLASSLLPAQRRDVDSFRPVSSFGVDGVAEIVDVVAGGRALIYTNSDKNEVGLVDIMDPRRPRALSTVSVPGEPTAVSVAGPIAVVAVWADKPKEGQPAPMFKPGKLVVLNLRDPRRPQTIGSIDIGFHPDNVKLRGTPAGGLVAIVAIENEPVVVENGVVTGDDEPGNPNDVSPAGFVQVISIDVRNLGNSSVVDVKLPEAALTRAGLLYPKDPQPEFVSVYGTTAAVSLQENNGIALIDISNPRRPNLRKLFSLGEVADRAADLTEDDDIKFNERYPSYVDGNRHPIPKDGGGNPVKPGSRFPDAITWSPDGSVIYSADEGELNFTGGRGFSTWARDGSFVTDDKGMLESIAVAVSHYPEGRSENKGIEIEGVTTARFGRKSFLFALSERGSFMAVFDIRNPRRPSFVQVLPTGISPEGVVAIPQRGLVVTADEESGTLSIFAGQSGLYTPRPTRPLLYGDSPWAAISGLSATEFRNVLLGVPDNALPTKPYAIQLQGPAAKVIPLLPVKKDGMPMNYDGEGIARDRSILKPMLAGFWIASEGDAKNNPNLLVQLDLFSNVIREIQLPKSVDKAADANVPGNAQGPMGGQDIRSNGFEGMTLSTDGKQAVTVIQRDFKDEFPSGDRYARIARYDLTQLSTAAGRARLCRGRRCGGDWDMFYLKLDSNDGDNWAGLSEIIAIGQDQYLVIERDKGIGIGSKLKKLYAFSLRGLTPDTDGKPDATDTVRKVEALDILDRFFPYEKVEGLALTRNGLWVGLDNDGGEVESRLINTGPFRNPLGR